MFSCLVVLMRQETMPPKTGNQALIEWVQFHSPFALSDGFLRSTHCHQVVHINVAYICFTRVEFKRAPDLSLGARPIPLIMKSDKTQVSVRFCEGVVPLQRAECGFLYLWKRLTR